VILPQQNKVGVETMPATIDSKLWTGYTIKKQKESWLYFGAIIITIVFITTIAFYITIGVGYSLNSSQVHGVLLETSAPLGTNW
jgi:uncharacterized membrane protein YagU involved in acid resistance